MVKEIVKLKRPNNGRVPQEGYDIAIKTLHKRMSHSQQFNCMTFVQCEYNHKVECPTTSEILVTNKVCLSDFSGYNFDESIIATNNKGGIQQDESFCYPELAQSIMKRDWPRIQHREQKIMGRNAQKLYWNLVSSPLIIQNFSSLWSWNFKKEMIQKEKDDKKKKVAMNNILGANTAWNKIGHYKEHLFENFNANKSKAYLLYKCMKRDSAMSKTVTRLWKTFMEIIQCCSFIFLKIVIMMKNIVRKKRMITMSCCLIELAILILLWHSCLGWTKED